MPTSAIRTWSRQKLEPALYADRALTTAIKLAASLDLARGTVMAEKIGTDEKQKLVITGGPTGGSFTMTFGGQTTDAIAYNAPACDVEAALEELSTIGDGNVRCYGGQLPDGLVYIEFTGELGGANQAQLTTTDSLTGGTTPATAVTTVRAGAAGTPGEYAAYDPDAVNGLQLPKGILVYDVQTDASGNATFSETSGREGGEFDEEYGDVPMYLSGYFNTEDLTGLDLKAVPQLGRLVSGTVADGVLAVL
jgi:hypothetical protein